MMCSYQTDKSISQIMTIRKSRGFTRTNQITTLACIYAFNPILTPLCVFGLKNRSSSIKAARGGGECTTKSKPGPHLSETQNIFNDQQKRKKKTSHRRPHMSDMPPFPSTSGPFGFTSILYEVVCA